MTTATVTGSTQEIADKMGVEYPTALAVLKLLVAKGVAQSAGVRPNPRGKGKGSNLFTVPAGPITLNLFAPTLEQRKEYVESLELPAPSDDSAAVA